MSKDDLSEILNDESTTHDNDFDKVTMNCAECEVPAEVVRHGKFFICLNCFFVDGEMSVCGWCNEGQIGGGALEFSALTIVAFVMVLDHGIAMISLQSSIVWIFWTILTPLRCAYKMN